MKLLMVKMITMTKILQFVADKEIHVNKHMRMVLMAVTRLYSSPAVYNSLQSTTKKKTMRRIGLCIVFTVRATKGVAIRVPCRVQGPTSPWRFMGSSK